MEKEKKLDDLNLNKEIVGYTTGVFDLFHVGHLNVLRNAKALCSKLIVGVTTDKLVEYKHKKSVIPYDERSEIIRNLKFVDMVIPQEEIDKFEIWKKLKFDILFVGDDWHDTPSWNVYEEKLKAEDVKVIYLPYTKKTSSTLINEILLELRNK